MTCRDVLADLCAGKDGALLSEIEGRIWWDKAACATAAYRIAQKTEMQTEVVPATVGNREGWDVLGRVWGAQGSSSPRFDITLPAPSAAAS